MKDGSFALTNSDNDSNCEKVIMNVRVATTLGKPRKQGIRMLNFPDREITFSGKTH